MCSRERENERRYCSTNRQISSAKIHSTPADYGKNVTGQHFMKIRHIGAVCKVISEYNIVSRRNIFKTTDGSFFSYFKYIFKLCAFKWFPTKMTEYRLHFCISIIPQYFHNVIIVIATISITYVMVRTILVSLNIAINMLIYYGIINEDQTKQQTIRTNHNKWTIF